MLKAKLIEVLRTFSKEEMKSFKDFVNSPFFNRNKSVIRLNDILKKYWPAFDSDSLNKQRIFTKLYPQKKYNDIVMRILISDLLKLSEEFLAYTRYKSTPVLSRKMLLGELKERRLDRLFERHYRMAEEFLNSSGIYNHYYFLDLYDLENQRIDFLISRDRQPETAKNIVKQGEYLACFSLIGLLNIVHELLSQKDVLDVSFNFELAVEYAKNLNLEGVVEYMRVNNYSYYPLIAIYYYMYKAALDTGDDESYFMLKKLIDENFNRFGKQERFNLLIILESICVKKISLGKTGFNLHLMEIYNFMIKENLYAHTEKDFIQINLFRNIFYTAVILKRLNWAEEFVEKFSSKVNPEQKDNILNFSRAVLLFEKRQFEHALESISKVNHKFFVYKFDSRVLTLKIFYELGAVEQAISLIDSFLHFLSNNRNIGTHDRLRFGRFLKYLREFIRLKTGSGGQDARFLTEKINSDSGVINQKWLLEKASEL